ncbi:hypothetical protein ACIQNI_08710 [Streptomyces sp. NPDC091266]|uniref:hypothetical protein n=1 Tax=Streptomyces sp. NPDC091266 TaxID=3365978 RepID=UPI0038189CC6
METHKIGRDYWANSEREDAEDNATEFVNAFRRLGIDFDDIHIENPCADCPREDYRIAIGRISAPEAGEFARKLNQALDLLAKYQQLNAPPKELAD